MKTQVIGQALGLLTLLTPTILAIPAAEPSPAVPNLSATASNVHPSPNSDILDNGSISSLEHTFNAIMAIPDTILEDNVATNTWLITNGYRPEDSTEIRRDLILSPLASTSIPEKRANWWTIAKCSASLVSLVATTAVPAAKLLKIKKAIEDLGGVNDTAKLLVGATKFSEWTDASKKVLLGLALEITGVGAVYTDCPFIATLVRDLKEELGM